MSGSNLEQGLVRIFDACQDSTAGHAKLLSRCQVLLKESDPDEFFNIFTNIIRNVLIVIQKNPHIDRTIDFIAKFASNPYESSNPNQTNDQTVIERQTRNMSANANNTANNTNTTVKSNSDTTLGNTQNQSTMMEEDEIENEFLTSLIDFLIDTSKANCDAVRYRCCHILSKLMTAISNEQFIDEDLYDRLSDALLERLKDINSRVQVQAIAAIYRLQDPNDRDCRISRVFLFLMTYDPNWMVRYQALSHVAFSKLTLPEIIDRVRDPNANVRKKALLILSEKVLIKFITIEKRLFILNYSLNDEDPGVLETSTKRLLPSWLAFKENDMVKLLKALDVVEATETMELMLNKMNANNSTDTLCDEFIGLLNEKHVIPMEKLNAESVFYWSWVCAQCKGKPGKEGKNTNESRMESEENLDRLLPSLTEFCEYTTQVMRKLEKENEEGMRDDRNEMENLFIIKQLIKMFEFLDFSDVHGKKTLTNLCHDLFSNKSYVFLFDSVMSVYKMLIPNLQQRINNLVELISDIKDPHLKIAPTMDEDKEASVVNETQEHDMAESAEESNLAKDSSINQTLGYSKLSPRELQLKISEAKYKRFQLKDQFDNLYKEVKNVDAMVDLNKLSDLRTEIKECEDEILMLEAYLKGDMQKIDKAQQEKTKDKSAVLDSLGPEVINEQAEKNEQDPIECTYHCLKIAICLLKDTSLMQITPQLRSLFDSLIIPNIGCVNEEIRINVVKAMSLICILKVEIAQKYVPLLLKMIQHDMKDVVIAAFQAIINCIMAFSMNRLANLDYMANETTENSLNSTTPQQPADPQDIAERTAKILATMTSLLDSEDPEIYTTAVEGFCKLYMTGHIVSAKLLSKLIIMYYSPITENDVKLRACLSTFLPQFAFFRPCNQVCVEETFMLILKSLINASPDSYLSEIDLTKVMEVMFNLTNPKNLMPRRANQRVIQNNNICHENIVRSICYEILKDDNSYKCKIYLKVMQMADLSNADYLALKSISELTDELHMHIGDKLIKKSALKFHDQVVTMMKSKPEYEEEIKRKEEEERVASDSNKTSVQSQEITLLNANQNDATHLDSTRLSTSGDMIDLGFKKLGKKAVSKKNRTIGITKIEELNAQDEENTEPENETVVEKENTETKRRSSARISLSQAVNDTVESQDQDASRRLSSLSLNDSQDKEKSRRSSPRIRDTNSSVTKPNAKKQAKSKIAISKAVTNELNKSLENLNNRADTENDENLRVSLLKSQTTTSEKITKKKVSRLTKTRSKSLSDDKEEEDSTKIESENENESLKMVRRSMKRSLTENREKQEAAEEEQSTQRSSRSQTRRSTNTSKNQDYEPPVKVSRETSRNKKSASNNLENLVAAKMTRSVSSRNKTPTNDDKKQESSRTTRQSTRSSSSK